MSTKVVSSIVTSAGLVTSGTSVDSSADGQALIRDAGALNFRALTAADLGTAAVPATCNFRLSLTSGDPCPAADVTGGTTLYAALNGGNKIALYDGSKWLLRSSAEFSLSLSTIAASTLYDVFCYDNAGTATLEFLAWSGTFPTPPSRATAIAYQDGVPCKSGALTRRYLGTLAGQASGQSEDSARRRFLWNYHDRRRRKLAVNDATSSWTYSTAAFQQARGQTANRVELVAGLAGAVMDLWAFHQFSNSTVPATAYTSIGENVTASSSADFFVANVASSAGAGNAMVAQARLLKYPAEGYRAFNWLEYGSGTGTCTFYGGPASGLSGWWEC